MDDWDEGCEDDRIVSTANWLVASKVETMVALFVAFVAWLVVFDGVNCWYSNCNRNE